MKYRSPAQRAYAKLDLVFKAWMKRARPYKCVTCKYWNRPTATEHLQWGHFITATKWGTRWDEMNVHWQCPPCNFQHEHNAYPYTQFMLDTYGRKAVDTLLKRSWSKEGKKYTVDDLNPLIEKYGKTD